MRCNDYLIINSSSYFVIQKSEMSDGIYSEQQYIK